MTAEAEIQNQIRVAVSQHDCTIFRTNVGTVQTKDGRWFNTGLPQGHPDLYGFRHSDGKLIYIEVKNERGKLRPDQIRFQNFIKQYPVLYGVCRSAEDAVKLVEEQQ